MAACPVGHFFPRFAENVGERADDRSPAQKREPKADNTFLLDNLGRSSHKSGIPDPNATIARPRFINPERPEKGSRHPHTRGRKTDKWTSALPKNTRCFLVRFRLLIQMTSMSIDAP